MRVDSNLIGGVYDLSGEDFIPTHAYSNPLTYRTMLGNLDINSENPAFGGKIRDVMLQVFKILGNKTKDVDLSNIQTLGKILENVEKDGFEYVEKMAKVFERTEERNFSLVSSFDLPLKADVSSMDNMNSFLDKLDALDQEQQKINAGVRRIHNMEPNDRDFFLSQLDPLQRQQIEQQLAVLDAQNKGHDNQPQVDMSPSMGPSFNYSM